MTPALERLLVESVAELFYAYRNPIHRVTGHVTPSPSRMPEPNLVGCFADLHGRASEGHGAWGRVLFVTSFDFIAACRPVSHPAPPSAASARDWIYLRDWTKQIAAELARRILAPIGAAGLPLLPGVPVVVTGDAVASQVAARQCPALRFVSGRHDLKLWFDAVVPARVDEALADGARTRVLTGGTMILLQERAKARASEPSLIAVRTSDRPQGG